MGTHAGGAGAWSIARIAGRIVAYASGIAAVTWVTLACWWLPGTPGAARGAAAATVLVGLAFLLRKRRPGTLLLASLAGIASILIVWSTQVPRYAADVTPDQACLARVDVDGDRVSVRNVRHVRYRSVDDYDVSWETHAYDAGRIESADFVVEPFGAMRGFAHTIVTFGFAGGKHVALSFEIEKRPGRPYNALRGLFRQYLIRAIVADERDVIGLRAEIRKDDVMVYPLRTRPGNLKRLFLLLMQRVESLATRPEHYNTLTNNCTTQYVVVYETLSGEDLGLEPRAYLPGYTDALALERGLIDWDGDVASARAHFKVNGRAPLDPASTRDGIAWSRRLRTRPSE